MSGLVNNPEVQYVEGGVLILKNKQRFFKFFVIKHYKQ
jgi:hypothetical protein